MLDRKIVVREIVLASAGFLAASAAAQQTPANPQPPQVKVHVINVCSPSAEEQKELSSALAKIPLKPNFGADYEVSRGHSTLDQSTPIPGMPALPAGAVSAADWVRVRREFPAATMFSNVQYSFSVDVQNVNAQNVDAQNDAQNVATKNMVETLVLRVRDPKDVMEVSIEDSASAVTSAAAMLATSTPISRVKLERFGKASVALARCPADEGHAPDRQAAYEPIFKSASSIMERYRGALGTGKLVPQELARLRSGGAAKPQAKTKSGVKKAP